MNYRIILSLPLLILLTSWSAAAQQSSKSKSKDRFREKDPASSAVRLRNVKEINSDGTDYSPMYYKNGIVFVSNRKKTGPRDPKTGETYSELYFSPSDRFGESAPPQRFSLTINSALNEGPLTFTRDFKTMYFTRNNMYKGVQKASSTGNVGLKIYEARVGPDDWELKGELPFNSDEYSCMHPALSPDGTKMYFASDMPGGFGGYDLYESEKINGKWQAPVNLGPEINTEKHEVFPFVHVAGTLFFASGGHNSMGGFDVFFVDKEGDNGAVEVVNMGEPFNSAKDDMGFILEDEGLKGYLSSNREPGYGKYDIFSFVIEKNIKGVEKPKSYDARIVITDSETGFPLHKAEIRVLRPSEDGSFVSNNGNDYYKLDLAPVEGAPNSLSLQLVRKGVTELGQPDLITNLNGEARTEFTRYRGYLLMVSAEGYQTGERFFSLENEDLNGPVRVSLSKAPACHKVAGIVTTEQLGTRIPNAQLRFIHKESGRAVNIRTSLNGEYEACLPAQGEYLIQVEKEGFKKESVVINASAERETSSEIRMRPTIIGATDEENMALTRAVKQGQTIMLDRIYYEPKKATLNQSATRNLDALVELMQRYPDMEIEMTNHTDTRGDAKFNQTLSEERASNAKSYMVWRGISEKRIKTAGKGGSEPRNRCLPGVECSEAEHKANIRTEVIVKRIGV